MEDYTPPPCASTAAVPKVQAKQGFDAHPVLRPARACARHTRQQKTVRDSHAGSSTVGQGRESHPNRQTCGCNGWHNVVLL